MPTSKKRQSTDISIVGAGTLASGLATALYEHGFPIAEIVYRETPHSSETAHALANKVKARATILDEALLQSKVSWICVPDDAISDVAQGMAQRGDWNQKIVVHSSGALGSEILASLKEAGAQIASAHPLMTFIHLSAPELMGVPFALEGDRKAQSVIGAIVTSLGGRPFRIAKEFKTAYHAFGFFCSPALVALIAAAQHVGALAGLEEDKSRLLMEPIVRQTIENCFRTSPKESFSGPLRRGDVETIRKHLEALKDEPNLLALYRAVTRIALQQLPVSNMEEIRKLIS